MKPTKLVIKNIGKIADETIAIDKPLILFYGEIKQGKTTILNCVRWSPRPGSNTAPTAHHIAAAGGWTGGEVWRAGWGAVQAS